MSKESEPEESLIGPGSQVDQFKVVRLLGRGGMAEVYLARDTLLGRKVALKVIRPETLGSEEAASRFLFEARATAKFAHPHIVTVHAAGQHEGVPYVALEYVEGQTLRHRIEEQRPSARESMRIALAMAEALGEAHRNGILHRDLKPENVLLPRDGRVRVVDFGLAKAIPSGTVHVDDGPPPDVSEESFDTTQDSFETHDNSIRGTPSYMAPEQWTEAPVSGATDVWALGAVLHELLVGRPPYRAASPLKLAVKVCGPDPVDPIPPADDAPTELCELVASCLEKDPETRPSAAQVAEALRDMLSVRHTLPGEAESPFRGLRPFSERHAEHFYGRAAETAAFVERLREDPVLPVVGPSGAGKSSFVQAGVIPRLREQGAWVVLTLRPGRSPFRTLASRFLARERSTWERTLPSGELRELATSKERDDLVEGRLAEELRASPLQLNLLLTSLAEHEQSKVLLFVDQLEELYALVDDEEERWAFMEAVCGAADDSAGPVRVVFTLRDDFLGRLAEGAAIREAFSHVTVLRSPGPEALSEILLRPVEELGYGYDDEDLVAEMVDSVRGEPACLPLLQFASRTLWDRRDRHRRLLCRDVYEAIGGVEGALANHADGVLEGLSPLQNKAARSLLLGLVTAEGTRRVVPREQLLEQVGSGGEEVLNRLTAARLVSVSKGRGESDEDAELELVHESLITRWRQLARWIDENREEMSFLSEVSQAAELWSRRGKREDEVWSGDALQEAQRNVERMSALPPSAVEAFLDAGRAHRSRTERRRANRRAALTVLLAVVAVAGTVFALAFRAQRQDALHQGEDARRSLAEAQREGAQAALARGDLLEARARLRASLEIQDSPLARALWSRLARDPLVWRRELGATTYGAVFSPDGEHLAVACQDHSIYIFHVRTRAVQVLRGHEDQVVALAFSPDGEQLASGTWTGAVRIWSLADESVRSLPGPEARVWSLDFSPDGRYLACGSDDRAARVWDLRSGAEARGFEGHTARVGGVAWSPDGRRLATGGGDRTIRLWDPETGEAVRVLEGHGAAVFRVTWSRDGRRLASAGHDHTARVWDPESGEAIQVLRHVPTVVMGAAWSPDGTRLATGAEDHLVRVWNVESGEPERVLRGHMGSVYSLDWSPDGELLASASYDSTVRLWDAAAEQEVRPPGGHEAYAYSVDFHPDGDLVASGGADGTVRIWDAETGAVTRVVKAHAEAARTLAFSPEGHTLATGGPDGLVRLWRLREGGRETVLGGHDADVNSVAWSPDGKRLASGGVDQRIRIWDVETRAVVKALRGHVQGVWAVAWSPDGRRLVSGSYDSTVRVWDLEGDEEPLVFSGHEGLVWGVAFHPEGREVASAGLDHTVRLWDTDTGQGRVLAKLPGRAYTVEYHPDGELLAASSSDGIARLLDRHSGEVRRALVGHRAEVNAAAWGPDGRRLVTTGDDSTVRLWVAESGRPAWWAPAALGSPPRLLSHRGWTGFDGSALDVEEGAFERALTERGRFAVEAPPRGLTCMWARGGDLETWDRPAGRQIAVESLEGLSAVEALPQGCATASDEGVRLHDRTGSSRQLLPGGSVLAWDGARLLVVAGREVHAFDEGGERVATYETGPGVTAMTSVGDGVVVGFADGSLERYGPPRGRDSRQTPFDGTASSQVVRIVPGPSDTLAVGYADGLVGIWSSRGGGRLHAERLHGPVLHLAHSEGRLYAATELGDARAFDLRTFQSSWCELLGEVWRAVPVVWRHGAPLEEAPGVEHPCAEQGATAARRR